MAKLQNLINQFTELSFYTTLMNLVEIYEQADTAALNFQNTLKTGCPGVCGICCERFHPDVPEAEALLAAVYIFFEKPELKTRIEGWTNAKYCPFFDKDKPHAGCSIYPVRPLVCRLFGFQSQLNKQGKPHFRYCKYMQANPDIFCGKREIRTDDFEALDLRPVISADFGFRIVSLSPSQNRQLLSQALPPIFEKIAFLQLYRKTSA